MQKNNKRIILITFAILISGFTTFSQAQLGWRGPDQSGIYNESGLLKSWPASGPALLWEATGIGTGFSSVTISDNAVYITGRKGEKDVLTSFSQDGKKKWETIYGKAWMANHTGSRCTPTYYNGNLFLISGSGDIVCIGVGW